MSASSEPVPRPLRVLSIPGRQHENRIFRLTLDALAQRGVTVVPPRPASLALFRYDVLHLNFPTHYTTENGPGYAAALTAAFGVYLLLARLFRRSIVYTVHDVVPFRTRNRAILWPFLRLVHAVVHAFVFISTSSRDAFVARYPQDRRKTWLATRHGPYPVTLMTRAERERRRHEILGEAGGFLLGFLGNIKPYKNIGALRGVPGRLADGRPVHLLVAGRAEQGHLREVQDVEQSLPPGQVTRIDGSLSDVQLDALIQISDAVLLPYLKGSNSGVAMLVLSNEGRLIGSDLPVFRELAGRIGAPWAYSADVAPGSSGLAQEVAAAAQDEVSDADRERLRGMLRDDSHANTAAALHALYDRLRKRMGRIAPGLVAENVTR